jgi:anaerobic magnesium-protoporphyrin IX monomethyl ester cyclase
MASLDLLLINPGSRCQVYQVLGESLSAIEPPVWAGLMATFVRNKGFSVAILDGEAENLSPAQVGQRVAELKPVLAAIVVYGHQPSASTQNMTASGEIATAIKQSAPEQKVLMVGGHVASLPEHTLREEDTDFVSDGEGLHTMLGLLQALKSNPAALSPADLDKVPGLLYWEGDAIRRTHPAPLVREVEREMPEMAWDLLPMDKYRAHNWHCFGHLQRQPYAAIYTTLGCPYHCSFCCIQAPFKSGEKEVGMKETVNSYRFWSPQRVGDTLERLVKQYGVRNVKIADEMFVLNKKHVVGICDEIIKRKLDLNIWAYARVDTVQDGMVDKLKQAGVNWLAFGIESANPRVQADVDKRFEIEQVYDTIGKVRAAGIHVIGNYIFGLPEDDLPSMQQTLDLALDLNCEFANLYSAMAYPGSKLYDDAVKRGLPLPEKWSGYSQHSVDTLPLPTKYLPASEVLKFRDHAFQVYFSHPRYLEMVTKQFGPATAQHIREMASHKLVRQFGA